MKNKIEDVDVLRIMQNAFSKNGGVIAGTDLYEHKFSFTNVKRVLEELHKEDEKEFSEIIDDFEMLIQGRVSLASNGEKLMPLIHEDFKEIKSKIIGSQENANVAGDDLSSENQTRGEEYLSNGEKLIGSNPSSASGNNYLGTCIYCKNSYRDEGKVLRCKVGHITYVSMGERDCFEPIENNGGKDE